MYTLGGQGAAMGLYSPGRWNGSLYSLYGWAPFSFFKLFFKELLKSPTVLKSGFCSRQHSGSHPGRSRHAIPVDQKANGAQGLRFEKIVS